MSDDEGSSRYVGTSGDLEFEMSDGTTFNFDTYNDCDWEYDYNWEEISEDDFNSDGSSGTLIGFVDSATVNIDIDMGMLYWDGEYLLSKIMVTPGKPLLDAQGEPLLSAQKWDGEELKEIDIDDLPKAGKDALTKEMI